MPTLKELSIAFGLLSSDPYPAAEADGWKDYVWRVRDVGHCELDDRGFCHAVSDRWDWKRPEFYEASYKLDEATNTITTRISLRNEDPTDSDQVCMVVSYLDADDRMVGIFFANWRSLPQRHYSREAPIVPSRDVRNVARIAVGSKQCEVQAAADARNFSRIRQLLRQR